MRRRKCFVSFGLVLLSFNLSGEVFTSTNSLGTAQNLSVSVGPGVQNLAVTVAGTATTYSHVFIRRTADSTQTSYEFSSQENAMKKGIYLEQPELGQGRLDPDTYWIGTAGSHAYPNVSAIKIEIIAYGLYKHSFNRAGGRASGTAVDSSARFGRTCFYTGETTAGGANA